MAPRRFVYIIRVPGNYGGGCRLSGRANFLVLSQVLCASARCPTGCNFVPHACNSSNSPLSILLLYTRALSPLALIGTCPVNIVAVVSGNEGSRGVVTVPYGSPACGRCASVSRLPGRIFSRVHRFFGICGGLRGGRATIGRMRNESTTMRVVGRTVKGCVRYFYGWGRGPPFGDSVRPGD